MKKLTEQIRISSIYNEDETASFVLKWVLPCIYTSLLKCRDHVGDDWNAIETPRFENGRWKTAKFDDDVAICNVVLAHIQKPSFSHENRVSKTNIKLQFVDVELQRLTHNRTL
jgi:hypothetical protein